MTNFISVIIPTYNPNHNRLAQTLAGLKEQTLDYKNWELIIVDNNSSQKIEIDLNWHQNSKIIKETKQGLSYARLKGFSESKGEIIVMVDDDNILDNNYLNNCLTIYNENRLIGAIGGKSIPQFETEPPLWINEFYGNLALRDLGQLKLIEEWNNCYPQCAPIGAGMAIRRSALNSYIKNNQSDKMMITDRTANSLASSGDNDIVLEILKSGWQVGYFPALELTHIIPKERLKRSYLARLVKDTNKSWILLLEKHQINPWGQIQLWTLPLRKVKAWFKLKAWQNEANYVKWSGACGTFVGLANIKKIE